ncbi:hypothetical protein [Uniformispora flossi]|uniref:hypothetical protein n=1 Tax=Uniformispora flossi TaxID=3390723 RepID=UPI003D0220E8
MARSASSASAGGTVPVDITTWLETLLHGRIDAACRRVDPHAFAGHTAPNDCAGTLTRFVDSLHLQPWTTLELTHTTTRKHGVVIEVGTDAILLDDASLAGPVNAQNVGMHGEYLLRFHTVDGEWKYFEQTASAHTVPAGHEQLPENTATAAMSTTS